MPQFLEADALIMRQFPDVSYAKWDNPFASSLIPSNVSAASAESTAQLKYARRIPALVAQFQVFDEPEEPAEEQEEDKGKIVIQVFT